MPAKVFRVASGYEVVKGYVTYGAGLVLDVEDGESVEVFPTTRRGREPRVGKHGYDDLEPSAPPRGLAAVE